MLGVKQLEEGGGSWKWSNIFFEEYICTREKNDWSSCFGSLSFFLFFQSVRIFNLRNWFCLLFPGLPFSTIVSVEEFLNWFSLHPFLFFFIFGWNFYRFCFLYLSIFLQFHMFGGENRAFFQSFDRGMDLDGRSSSLSRNEEWKWNSWELRPDGFQIPSSHFWKEIRAE